MGKNYIGEIRYIDKEPEFFPKESGKKPAQEMDVTDYHSAPASASIWKIIS